MVYKKKVSLLSGCYDFFENLYRFFMYVNFQFLRNHCISSAAALSFNSLLALVPLLSIAFAILSSFHVLKDVKTHILNYIFNHFFLESRSIIQEYLEEFISNIQHLDVVGLSVLIFSMLLVFTTIEKTFNAIWYIEKPRPFIQRVLAFWALITLGPLMAGIGVNILLSIVIEFSQYDYLLRDPIIQIFSFILPFFILSIIFTILYLIIPNHPIRLCHAVLGGTCTALTLELCRHAFVAYITYLPSYQIIYRTLSILPLFIIWMYIFWGLLLYGAQIVSTLPDWRNIPDRKSRNIPSTTGIFWSGLRVLRALYGTSSTTGLTSQEIIKRIKIGSVRIERLLHKFHSGKIIEMSLDSHWFLIGNPETIPLHDVYAVLGFGIKDLNQLETNHSPWEKNVLTILKKLQAAESSCLNATLGDIFGPYTS